MYAVLCEHMHAKGNCFQSIIQLDNTYNIDIETVILYKIPRLTGGAYLLFYVLATSKVISGQVLSYDSAHSWQVYSGATLGNEAVSTMTWYPTVSYHAGSEPTNHYPILVMLSTWLGSDQYQLYKLLVWLDHVFELTISRTWDQCSTDLATTPSVAVMHDDCLYIKCSRTKPDNHQSMNLIQIQSVY